MRTENSIKNSLSSLIQSSVTMIIGFIAQAIFLKILSMEYLGLNGLFTNILTMLSIFELGIGDAIIYNLYKPIADNNIKQIKSLMNFYKKAYNIIALIVLIVGLFFIPFLKLIVGEIAINVNIYIIYLLFLLSTVCSYFIAYKRNLIYANQKNYIINIIHIFYTIILNIMQLGFLYFTKNYYIYLIIKIICQLLENIIINFIADKMYPFLKEKNSEKLEKNVEKNIFTKVKALFFHKIGNVIVSGTDNIIISSFLSVVDVGLYSNYFIIINAVNTLFSQIISSTTASVGNMLILEDTEKRFGTFKKIRFLNFWLACFGGVAILTIIQPFIKLWIGEEYLLPLFTVIVLVINFYQKMMRRTYGSFKDAAGIWVEDKYVPLIEAFLNIVFSITLVKVFDMAGVFLGTIISGLTLWIYSYPKYVYKKLFNRSYRNYMIETVGYLVLFSIILTITYCVSLLFVFSNNFVQVLVNSIISLIIPNFLIILIFRNTENFKYFLELIKKVYNQFQKKVNKT